MTLSRAYHDGRYDVDGGFEYGLRAALCPAPQLRRTAGAGARVEGFKGFHETPDEFGSSGPGQRPSDEVASRVDRVSES